MKRKLALFLAVMMTLSLLPMNVFAASENRLSTSPTTLNEKTALLEPGLVGNGSYYKMSGNDDVKYFIEGPNLIIKLKDYIQAGTQFKIELGNAQWFFRADADTTPAAMTAVITSATGYNAGLVKSKVYGNVDFTHSYDWLNYKWTAQWNGAAAEAYPSAATKNTSPLLSADIKATYNTAKGVFGHYIDSPNNKAAGIYFRIGNGSTGNSADGTTIPYVLDVQRANKSIAVLTVLSIGDTQAGGEYTPSSATNGYCIEIPLVSLTGDNKDVTVDVDTAGQVSSITSQRLLYSKVGSTGTSTSVTDPATARDEFPGDDAVVIKETRLGSITSGQIYFKAPSGFEFENLGNVRVALEAGLGWGDENNLVGFGQGYGAYSSGSSSYGDYVTLVTGDAYSGEYINGGYTAASAGGSTYSNVIYPSASATDVLGTKNYPVGSIDGAGYGYRDSGTGFPAIYRYASASAGSTPAPLNRCWDWAMYYKGQGTGSVDRSAVCLTLNGVRKSTQTTGAVVIENLKLVATDSAPFGPINVEVTNVDSSVTVVTPQTFLWGTRVDWTLSLTTEGTIPELVNGRYDNYAAASANDADHKTAKVVFAENSTEAWWAGRIAEFKLPEGVKFRKVKFTDADNLLNTEGNKYKDSLINKSYYSAYWQLNPGNGVYLNDGEKHGEYGTVCVDGNKMTLSNFKIASGKKAKLKFDIWVSIQSGFEGDVTLTVSGSGIPDQTSQTSTAGSSLPSVVIAKQISPVTIKTKVNDIKIGYQYQTTADIEITENRAGVLQKDKQVRLSISDFISKDMYFTNTTKVSVKNAAETGALQITAHNIGNLGNLNLNNDGEISFTVDRASTKASTILISDVGVKIDRTVPESNKQAYKAIVWGSAIANNYAYLYENNTVNQNARNLYNAKDKFTVAGIMTDYLKVASAANDKSGILTSEVKVTTGEKYYTVNGIQHDMPVSAYISEASNSTMVPLRFVANGLGVGDEGVIWDNDLRQVTIVYPGKILQFKIGDPVMRINSAEVTMTSPDGLPVSAEIRDDRAFVPFRALGDAFAVPVSWDGDTNTAIYNKGVLATVTSETAPVDVAAPATK